MAEGSRVLETESDEVECEDGIDTATGALCVDDEEPTGMCGGEGDDEEGGDDAEGDAGVDCQDGIATGAECDGGPSANQNDGEEEESEEGDENDDPTDAAVADHNLPAAVGCEQNDEDDGDDVDCEDGIVPATGAECDGGPGAN